MRRSRRIYKRKSRSNLETLIILIGAIFILSVAFYMAREKSFLPPEEIESDQQIFVEEEIVQEGEPDQQVIEELVAQGSPVSEKTVIQEALEQPEPAEVTRPSQQVEPVVQGEGARIEGQAIPEVTRPTEIVSEVEQPTLSGIVYTIQVGYFSVEGNAKALAAEIGNRGFQTAIVKHNNAFKVQVGAYQERGQAERASQQLKNMGYEVWITQR